MTFCRHCPRSETVARKQPVSHRLSVRQSRVGFGRGTSMGLELRVGWKRVGLLRKVSVIGLVMKEGCLDGSAGTKALVANSNGHIATGHEVGRVGVGVSKDALALRRDSGECPALGLIGSIGEGA